MSSNIVEPSHSIDTIPDVNKSELSLSGPPAVSSKRYVLTLTQGTLNLIAYLLIGIVVGINVQFACRHGPNLNPVLLHIILCVVGYQALMGAGILILAPESLFSHIVSVKHKRYIHSFLLLAGSILALWGSFVISIMKNVNFDTIHGQTSLPATICTCICFFNGIASLYAYEWRNYIPSTLSKVTHIFSGIVAFSFATISLAYGLDKSSFRNWATNEFTTVLFVFCGIFTAIVILNPFITLYTKLSSSSKKD